MVRNRSATLVLVIAALLGACGPVPRLVRILDQSPTLSAPTEQAEVFGIGATDTVAYDRFLRQWEDNMARVGKDGVVALGLSGGGSVGAFGAGVISGWPHNTRPEFTLVTGVSTGAMIAPFAFAGPEWNDALRRAFLDPAVVGLTVTGLGAMGRPSLYSGVPLSRLVERHATPELIATIAQRHRDGSRLLIATTNIDSLETTVWNMGAIAVAAQETADQQRAVRLFRSIIVGSASVPGYFPPIVLPNAGRSELHVDGAVNAPLILLPEAVATRDISGRLRPLRLYVIVNGQVEPSSQRVRGGFFAVVGRSLTSMGRATLRAHLQIIGLFARRHGAEFRYAAVPGSMEVNPLQFRLPEMVELFQYGRTAASDGRVFQSLRM